MCTAQDRIGGITGDPAVMVIGPGGLGPRQAADRLFSAEGRCGTGIIPLPNDRIIRSEVEMAIEKCDATAHLRSELKNRRRLERTGRGADD